MNQLEEGNTYKTVNGDTAEIFKIIDGVAYGRITFDREKNTLIAYQWRIDGTSLINSESANIIFDKPQPSWHQYVADGYAVLCLVCRESETNKDIPAFVTKTNADRPFFEAEFGTLGSNTFISADPITTQCGKYITGMKDGKTVLLPIEYAKPEMPKSEHKEPSPDLKVDDLVWVWNDRKQYKKIRCFSGWSDGKILTWSNGETSAHNTIPFEWKYWEKYQPEHKKPPLGLVPRFIHNENRIREIDAAIARYNCEGKNIPPEWQEERDCLKKWLP